MPYAPPARLQGTYQRPRRLPPTSPSLLRASPSGPCPSRNRRTKEENVDPRLRLARSPSLFLDHFSLFFSFHLSIALPPFPFRTSCSRRASPNGATAHAAHCATLPSPIATASQQALVKPPEVYLSHGSSSTVRTVVTITTTTPLGGLAMAAFKKSSKAGCGGVRDGGESSAPVTQPAFSSQDSVFLLASMRRRSRRPIPGSSRESSAPRIVAG
ncbi:hypothetical protein CH63R_04130 [Colletotrichum higginsianum IMI 349063]|uniref:Uncharacterized protein n=1 Tax=Colletotrichum higginsianum (strain IMI 349063) TaxID=759273 RepID=A0A1B7YIY3_COLHI|nr:hypothetical protein CH63R_04130 [Colletotrichum higginsianum IMI 349063]OBR11834.1 hypothetical protein CH63R_04130 [Colletotrichum higginsianum IMI 349063]